MPRILSFSRNVFNKFKHISTQMQISFLGFVQKHENEIPGLFHDNSRTFFSFQGLNFIYFQAIFDCLLPETAIRK